MKKKLIMMIVTTVGLLLLVSCKPEEGIGPVEFSNNGYTPTPIIVPTCTPTATPTPDPSKLPTVTEAVKPTVEPTEEPTPTEAVEPTKEPTPTLEPTAVPTSSPEPTATPTPSPEPTAEPTPTQTVEPTPAPTEEPTLSPEPTATPTLSLEPTAEPTPLPTATPVPEPVVAPELLVNAGWQKTVSIEDGYVVIFPDLFRSSSVTKTNQVLEVAYTCKEDDAIKFSISYQMQKNLEEAVKELQEMEKATFEATLEESRVHYRWQKDGIIYKGILLESRYPKTLLGTAFGEEEWTVGVMQVEFSYPVDRQTEYETTEYNYYLIENREE